MRIEITTEAQKEFNIRQYQNIYINILKGGCFGYRYVLSAEKLDQNAFIYKEFKADKIHVQVASLVDLSEMELDLTIDYITSIMKRGFEVRTNLKTCCCNKSFGFKIDKKQCLTD